MRWEQPQIGVTSHLEKHHPHFPSFVSHTTWCVCVYMCEFPMCVSVCFVYLCLPGCVRWCLSNGSGSEKVSSWGLCAGWPIQIADYLVHTHSKPKGQSDLLAASGPQLLKHQPHQWWLMDFNFLSPLFISLPPSRSLHIRLWAADGGKRDGRGSWGAAKRAREGERGHKLSEV